MTTAFGATTTSPEETNETPVGQDAPPVEQDDPPISPEEAQEAQEASVSAARGPWRLVIDPVGLNPFIDETDDDHEDNGKNLSGLIVRLVRDEVVADDGAVAVEARSEEVDRVVYKRKHADEPSKRFKIALQEAVAHATIALSALNDTDAFVTKALADASAAVSDAQAKADAARASFLKP